MPALTPLEPRAARTHTALVETLLRLLRDADLSEISVAHLCREAGVHRTTFYGHYDSIESLASAVFSGMLDDLADVGDDTSAYDTTTPGAVNAMFEANLVAMLQHVVDNRGAYRRVFALANDAGFRRDLQARMAERGRLAMEIWHRHGLCTDADAVLTGAYVAGGLNAALEVWAASDREDVDVFVKETLAALPAGWPHLLRRRGHGGSRGASGTLGAT